MSEKGFGSKIVGLFVETDADTPSQSEDEPASRKTPAQELAKLAATSAPAQPALSLPVHTEGPPPNFETLFKEAGMDSAELDRVAKAEQLLKTLPADAPQAVKKQVVEASLRAFGFETQRIVAAAQNQQRAIDTYVKVNETATARALQDTEAQVKALTDKIAALRAEADKRSAALAALNNAARARKLELQKVLDFFATGTGA